MNETVTGRHAVPKLLASARQLVDGSREMVAWSIARLVATNPTLIAAERGRTGAAPAPGDILLKLLHSPCDLEVLTFAHRHPRALLTLDDIARAVGYDAEEVCESIETLTAAGLIACTKVRRAVREAEALFYEFTPGACDAILPALCWVTASADGRRVLRKALLRTQARRGVVASKLH